MMKTITVRAPVNIAVIKYWGKKNEELIIPLNDSISGTLSMNELCATTTIAISDTFQSNQMWLNDQLVSFEQNKRLQQCIQYVKDLVGADRWPSNHFIHICSRNNFPTAAGLASSAAGLACLSYALCKLFSIDDLSTISSVARLGSGSACRSVYGGFVQWIAGHDMQTSIAKQIITETEWPEIRVLILVVSDHNKETSSTSGMKQTCQTSELLPHRAEKIVPKRCQQITQAIQTRDFEKFAEITMKDSNQFHAICLDTFPPIRYMNEISWSIVHLIHELNKFHSKNIAAYTFDAGPNACIYCLKDHCPQLINLIRQKYPTSNQELPIQGIQYNLEHVQIDQTLLEKIRTIENGLKYIISTKLGSGPEIITKSFDTNSLLNTDGLPK